jgi:hypothetical protein
MKKTLLRAFNANVVNWDIKQVEPGKFKAGEFYLELSTLDSEKSSRIVVKEMKKTDCLFIDQDDKENIELFKKEKEEGKAFFIPVIKKEKWEFVFDFDFCHLHQNDSVPTETSKVFKKGDKVLDATGNIKWTNKLTVDIINDPRIKEEDPEKIAMDIVTNPDLCFIKPVQTTEELSEDNA